MTIPGENVIIGYCDAAAAGVRLLQHVRGSESAIDSTLSILDVPVLIRTFGNVSLLIIRDVVADDKATLFAAELTDLLIGKKVVLLTAPNVPMTTREEECVFWTQYSSTKKLIGLPENVFQPIPLEKWTLKDAFLCSCLHFFQVEMLSLTILLVRGYKYTGRTSDGTSECIIKLSQALPLVLDALQLSTTFKIDAKSASVMKMLTMAQNITTTPSTLLYN
ncbi:hypothetical protein THRCLA_20410 [Thraustotheca clavata]|uniref:Proteasome assembly chaperone 1 n=1 Tax=Thraustotheca clavata TaxID=74557 RepID=A0A1W0A7H7_9STRA|nr:hypothetical protein THRCLA_20410 [Thraustotheca clavata]